MQLARYILNNFFFIISTNILIKSVSKIGKKLFITSYIINQIINLLR